MNTYETAIEIANGVRSMIIRLTSKAKTPEDHFKTMRQVLKQHDEIMEKTILEGQISIACQRGCSFCCYLQVDARAHEVLYLAHYLRERLEEVELCALIERCRVHRCKVIKQTLFERQSTNNRCPLLLDEACIAHAVRPITCRNYHAKDVNRCKEMFAAPEIHHLGQGTEDLRLKRMGALLWITCSDTYTELGYDARTYDLGSALYEALTSKKPNHRWRDMRAAFSTEATAKEPS